MNRIGLVTLTKRNYGSALQCYATKTIIEKMGFACDVLEKNVSGVDLYKHYFKELISLGINSILYRGYFKNYMSMRRASKNSINSLYKQSAFKLDLFEKSVLQKRLFPESVLKDLGRNDLYSYFITGSDQVWNGSRKADGFYFLDFAPDNKKIAFAPSFGCNEVSNFNIRKFRKYISKFPALSSREQRGVELIKELIGREAERLSDPTVLLSADEWRNFASDGLKHEKPYVFVHFLDEPNDIALESIKSYSTQNGYDVIIFAYPHKTFEDESAYQFVDGGPEDYVSLIDGAEFVFTDSFHSSLFSINLNTPFAVYNRQYRHGNSQSSRIETLLELFGCKDRYILNQSYFCNSLLLNAPNCDDVLASEREKLYSYLNKSIVKTEEKHSIPNLKNKYECTGCALCADVCKNNAITMVYSDFGYCIPQIDAGKCIKCGLCESFCRKPIEIKPKSKTAYIAYNRDTELANKSASGGVFSALAAAVLNDGGVVYGSCLSFEYGKPITKHRRVDSISDLDSILKSKYVQSRCDGIYDSVKSDLLTGKTVLFCGTSCQVAALYRFLGKHYENLFTVDLICHGVPGDKFFSDYIAFLEQKYKKSIIDISFRTKSNAINYELTILFDDDSSTVIPWEKSSYYRLFLSMNSYRDNCYYCEYASVNKPADITVGDYFEVKYDYPELCYQELKFLNGINCVFVNGSHGSKLIDKCGSNIELIEVDINIVQNSHSNLCRPSNYSDIRKKVFNKYSTIRYFRIERYMKFRHFFSKLILKNH